MTVLVLVLACAAHRAALEVAPAGPGAEVSSAAAPSAGAGGREAATIPYTEADILGALDIDDFDAALVAQIEPVRQCYQESPFQVNNCADGWIAFAPGRLQRG